MTGNPNVDHEMISKLFDMALKSGNMDFQRLTNLCHLLMRVEEEPGDVVEFGCHAGTTAALLAYMSKKTVWLYDSFHGLPEPTQGDEGRDPKFQKGALSTMKQTCLSNLHYAQALPRCRIVESWFHQIQPNQLPERIAFAHIDADFYESTFQALCLAHSRMAYGGVIVVDDYGWHGLPGVRRAVQVWMENKFDIKGVFRPEQRHLDYDIIQPKMLGYDARAHQAWITIHD